MKKTTIFLLVTVALTGLYFYGDWYSKQKASHHRINTPAAVVPADPDSLYMEVSSIRKEYSLPQMAYSQELNLSASDKCSDMVEANYYSHENPKTGKKGYSYIESRLKNAVYASENLNEGPPESAKYFVGSWMNSASHRSSILDARFTHTGFAVCNRGDKFTVVQHMAEVKDSQSTQANCVTVNVSNGVDYTRCQ